MMFIVDGSIALGLAGAGMGAILGGVVGAIVGGVRALFRPLPGRTDARSRDRLRED
jgi:hypothetical protein